MEDELIQLRTMLNFRVLLAESSRLSLPLFYGGLYKLNEMEVCLTLYERVPSKRHCQNKAHV
jgi:hypothetical protein